MGKSSRSYGFREIKGQRREVLTSAEVLLPDERELARRVALERAAAAPPVPVKNKVVKSRLQDGAMELDGEAPGANPFRTQAQRQPSQPVAPGDAGAKGEARLRRVLGSSSGVAIARPIQKLKKAGLPVHPNSRKQRALKKAMKRGANLE